MESQTVDPFAELDAMRKVAEVLTPIEQESRKRVLKWACETYGLSAPLSTKRSPLDREVNPNSGEQPTVTSSKWTSIAEFYAVANPQSEPEKVAIVAYWFQVNEGHPDFDSQRVNTELKHLGHGVGNVTAAFSALMNRKPQYVIQTRKSGTTQQARKRYMLTSEGKKFVEGLITPAA